MKLLTVNALDLYRFPGDAVLEERYERVAALIRSFDADIIAVQEIIADGVDAAAKRPGAVAGLRQLAEAVGRRCDADGVPALAVGGIMHHTGLLWRDGITVVPGSVHTLTREGAGTWHCAVSAVFDVGGPRMRVGSVQLSPFDQTRNVMDVNQLLRVFNPGDVAGFLGGDFNGVGADPGYDPDPYQGVGWHPDFVYQLDQDGAVDRRATVRLESPRLGRMQDCARLAGVPWTATTGHHPADAHPSRRIDRWYGTHHVPAAAILGVAVADRAVVGDCTDHCPVLVEVDPARLHGQSRVRR
ncbi:endonuclease/exonuclease/phosphatase family protein [Dactylosporangium sp. NPDC051485]|uniref:endonuclease/exonuclease/phosphatase family protein n=1 Tax=Dactylosporangium sp. NPDC051485 TaxID=3154846 RepID=UPI0034465FC6